MKKGRLKNGTNMYIINTKHFVSKDIFCVALSEHCHLRDIKFSFTKTQAREILKTHLFFNGIGSEFKALEDVEDEPVELNKLYKLAEKWVELNYPYLNNN